jgi:hypothetical protein
MVKIYQGVFIKKIYYTVVLCLFVCCIKEENLEFGIPGLALMILGGWILSWPSKWVITAGSVLEKIALAIIIFGAFLFYR